ncbi:alpha/beta hydrolase [Thauera sp.]|jgi:4,5:9,10-diseco-3-hydroxy-5,9,17-trioxoandrosta-1(10),2-diene-4-oate hydrolase|uniref:alpha/beta fold hydrolase n=1 Tax=Thauera sp. TaxID=1905334 RepID=UPI002A36F102|nr:alpha/beta hydrolase [Thauera sp.]MDX9887166.1 alpha/beta hydrolase [Thauera sp.]
MTSLDLPIPLDQFAELDNGLRLHYLDVGEGPVVVWLHGSGPGASGYSNFKGNYPAFAEAGFRNIVLDLPGFGRSDKPADIHYDLDFFVSNLNAFLKTIGVARCTLLGNSLGGAIALGQALAHPETVERLILMAPGGVEARETYFRMEGIVRMVETFAKGPMGPAEMRHVMSLQVFDPDMLDDEIINERAAIAPLQPANLFSTMMVPDMTARLHEISAPIFGFWGTNDRFNPHTGALKVIENAPDARIVLLNQCGHWVQVEHRDLFNRSCIDFMIRG